jgi:hypothetical protein
MFAGLRRTFDFVCALAGLALLILLGPWMLLTEVGAHIPAAQELSWLNGTPTARLDRVVLAAMELTCTAMLLWLGWAVARGQLFLRNPYAPVLSYKKVFFRPS